jgi:transposase-like protein
MPRGITPTPRPSCPNGDCPAPHVLLNGSHQGRKRYHCRGCGRYFGETEGTPLYKLKTPPQEIAHALLVLMRRGSLRAAEEMTGHKYETIGEWLRLAAAHAEAMTAVLATDLHLEVVEIDEFWSFVRKKTHQMTNPMPENAGDVSSKTGPVGSSSRMRTDGSVMTSLTRR